MFKSRLMDCAAQVQLHLDSVLVPMGDLPVVQAMRYASHGGKRLRAFLVLESARLHGIAPESGNLARSGDRSHACLFAGA